MDNSGTKKEGVAYTYKGHDGYAPIAAYLGQEGWSLGCDLRIGSQHSQKEFLPFLGQVIQRARRITRKPLLLRLDSGHDAEDSRREVACHKNVDHIIKLNPRSTYTTEWWLPRFEEANVTWHSIRDGKDYATLSVAHDTDYGQQRLVLRIIRRTSDAVGQMILSGPDYELEGWWTTLEEEHYSEDDIIALYKDHATSEQFHSEFKTDLDLERLPSGKFATNALVMSLAALTYNILRCMGQKALLGPDSPVRHTAKRRRLKTVMQELIYQAARLVKSGRQYTLRFSRHSPGFRAYRHLLSEYALC
ncbi:MAG: IS1380 family transposase [Endozoicomonas sp.]